MKKAFIITNSEMTKILKGHLAGLGWNTSGLTLRFTSTNAVVAGIYRAEEDCDEPEGFDDEDEGEDSEDETDWDDGVQAGINEGARALLEKEPHTVGQLAVALGVSSYAAQTAIGSLGAQAVSPVREDGCTVSAYMVAGTEAFDAFVATEKARIEARTEELSGSILSRAPKFHERGDDRPAIVERICEGLEEADAEGLRRDAKAVFYRMAEAGTLEHKGHSWRAGKTEADIVNVNSLQGAVREVLMANNGGGLSRGEIAVKLPGEVEDSLLRHAIKRMTDVYEQGGLLFHNS